MPWVAWPIALLIGAGYYGSKAGLKLPSLPKSTNGSYVYEPPNEAGGAWIRLDLKGERAILMTARGDREVYRVERAGETLRFVDEEITEKGDGKPESGVGRVGLAKIVDDGQALRITDEELDIKLVRQ